MGPDRSGVAERDGRANLRRVTFFRRQLGFWVFLLTGSAVVGFDPQTDGLDGIKTLVRKRFPEVRQLNTGELAAWLADTNRLPPLILDVREEKEFAVSHLQGARRVRPDERAEALKALVATNRPLVVYCSVGYRSSELAKRLMNAGMTNVFNLEGSIFQWANEGRPLFNDEGPAHKVHPYSERWGALLKPGLRGTSK